MSDRAEATWIAWGIERAQSHANLTVLPDEKSQQ